MTIIKFFFFYIQILHFLHFGSLDSYPFLSSSMVKRRHFVFIGYYSMDKVELYMFLCLVKFYDVHKYGLSCKPDLVN